MDSSSTSSSSISAVSENTALPKTAVPSSASLENWVTVRIPLVEPTGETTLACVDIPYDQYVALTGGNNGNLVVSSSLITVHGQTTPVSIENPELLQSATVSPTSSASATCYAMASHVQQAPAADGSSVKVTSGELVLLTPIGSGSAFGGVQEPDASGRCSGVEAAGSSSIAAARVGASVLVPASPTAAPRETRIGSLENAEKSGSESKRYKCKFENCGKSYLKSSHYHAHLRAHYGQRPFVCNYNGCEKSFTRTDELKRHQLTHTGEKNFTCAVCFKKFLRKDHTLKHIRQVHPDKSQEGTGSKITVVDSFDE